MPAVTLADLKNWIEHAPKVECKNPELVGWTGSVGFVCSGCAARITGRGCGDRVVFASPVWKGNAEALKDHDCVLCGAHWHGGGKPRILLNAAGNWDGWRGSVRVVQFADTLDCPQKTAARIWLDRALKIWAEEIANAQK